MTVALAIDPPVMFDVDGGSLPVAVAGRGPPLMLLHGWTLDHRMWRPQVAALGARFRLIMLDRRGFGSATAPPDLTREADDIARIADALGLAQFALAGLSQGAGVALDFALRHPERLRALVLAGTPLPDMLPDPDPIPRADYAALARAGLLARLHQAWLAHPLMQVGRVEGRALLQAIVADYDARDLLAPSALAPFTREAIAALPVRLLAVAGSDETPWRIACARLLAETAPDGQFASIANAGHIANVAQPNTFNAAMIAFLDTSISPLP